MSLPLKIACRYLVSKKGHQAVNIISIVAVGGVVVATAALICVLSVFNGFRDLVASLFTSFDPELRITLTEGKTHEVRRIFAHYGREVTALRRISLGDLNITEETADCGLLRELTSDEISGLKRLTGL